MGPPLPACGPAGTRLFVTSKWGTLQDVAAGGCMPRQEPAPVCGLRRYRPADVPPHRPLPRRDALARRPVNDPGTVAAVGGVMRFILPLPIALVLAAWLAPAAGAAPSLVKLGD